jgi:phage tail-like protein
MVDLATIRDAAVGYGFAIEIAGIAEAMFTECTGLEAHLDVFEYKEGGQNSYSHKLPGRRTYSNVTLKQGLGKSRALWDWVDGVVTKKDKAGERKNISIILYNTAAIEIYRWNLIGAYPVKWTGPTFATKESSTIFESLELAFQEFTVQVTAR